MLSEVGLVTCPLKNKDFGSGWFNWGSIKTKALLRKASVRKQGFIMACQWGLIVSTACWMRQHHKRKGKFWPQLDILAIKSCLNIWIDLAEIRAQ